MISSQPINLKGRNYFLPKSLPQPLVWPMTQETMTLSPTLQQPPHYIQEMTSFQFLLTFLYTSPGHTSKSFSTRIHTRD